MKQSIIPEEKVVEEVNKAIVDGLDIKEGSVAPDSSLIRDLNAESLDFLDINYRLEQTFGIKLARHSILEHMEEMFGEESAIDENGRLTEKAAAMLRRRFGDGGASLEPGMDIDEVPAIVTVRSIVDGVLHVLDSLPDKCTSCGASAWTPEDGSRIKCGSCGEYAVFTNGDDLVREWLQEMQEEEKIF